MAISANIHTFHTDAEFDVPCIVVQGYDADGVETDVEGDTVTAFVYLLGWDGSKKVVTKGTDAGEFEFTG